MACDRHLPESGIRSLIVPTTVSSRIGAVRGKKRELVAKYVKFGTEVKNLKTVIPDLLKRVEELHES